MADAELAQLCIALFAPAPWDGAKSWLNVLYLLLMVSPLMALVLYGRWQHSRGGDPRYIVLFERKKPKP